MMDVSLERLGIASGGPQGDGRGWASLDDVKNPKIRCERLAEVNAELERRLVDLKTRRVGLEQKLKKKPTA